MVSGPIASEKPKVKVRNSRFRTPGCNPTSVKFANNGTAGLSICPKALPARPAIVIRTIRIQRFLDFAMF
jgi:hypothetical protein